MAPRGRLQGLLVPLALLGLAAALFPAAVFRGEVFYDRDIHLEWYSQMEGFVRALAAGSWPVWDNSIGFGQPLLADPSAQVLYPPTWLNLVVLPWTYYTIFVVLHLLVAGLGLFALGRGLGFSRAAAFLGAAVFIYSGPLVSLVNLWHHFAGAAYIPWVVLGALRVARSEAGGEWPRLLAALALQILAGSADMCAMSLLVVGAILLAHAHRHRPWGSGNLRVAGGVALAVLLAAGVTAASWMTALEVVARSPRRALPETVRTLWSVAPLGALQTLLPVRVRDLSLPPGAQAAFHDGANPFLASLYLGLPVAGLLAAATAGGRRRLLLGLSAQGAGAFLIALGRHTPFYGIALAVLPPFRTFRYPMKAMVFVSLAVALLAGLGFEALRARRPGAVARAAALAAILGLIALAGAAGLAAAPRQASRAVFGAEVPLEGLRTNAVSLGLAGFLGLLCAALWLATSRPRALAVSLILVLADLNLAQRGLIPTTPRELVVFRPPVVEALGPPDRQRLYVYEYFLTPDSSRRYLGRDDPYPLGVTLPSVPFEAAQVLAQRLYPFPPVAGRWGYEGSFDVDTRGLFPPELSALVWRLRAVEGTPRELRLLRLGAVSRVVSLHSRGFEDLRPVASLPSLFPEPIQVFEVPETLPRAYAVAGVRVAAWPLALSALEAPDFDPRGEIVLEAGLGKSAGAAGSVQIVDFRPDRVRLEADLVAPGNVVLVDAFSPGWTAAVDGQPAPVLRANGAFRAVPVGAGRHHIELVYRPAGLRRGLWTSVLTGLGLMAWALGRRTGWSSSPATG